GLAGSKGILLADEKFDFDLSLSSSSANEDDEVFFGPVGHRERCIAASLELNHQIAQQPPLPASDGPCTLSPLSAEKFVEVYREAHLLALQLERVPAAGAGSSWSQGVEKFIQESKLKMKLFEKEEEMEKSPKSLKRETYYLSDSPFPPSGEPLLPASSLALPSTSARVGPVLTQGLPSSSCPLPGEPGAVRPPDQAVPPKRVASELQLPRASLVRGRPLPSALEKPKTERPASPSRVKLLNEKQPHRDVLLDKPSLALDAVSLPAHGSHLGQGKRSLPVPSKKTLLKLPGYTGSLTRKSSSSGSVSSRTSSVCASPAAGKAGELAGDPGSSSRPLPSTGKPARVALAVPCPSLPTAPTGASCRPARRANTAESMDGQPRAPSTAPLALPQTPRSGGPRLDSNSMSSSSQPNKIGSIRRQASCLNSKTKVMPTPSNPSERPKFSTGLCSGLFFVFTRAIAHSTPARRSSGPTSQSLLSSRGTPTSARRVSALPTPGGWRLSGLPLMTPKTLPRALASPLCAPARRLSSEPQRRSAVRGASSGRAGGRLAGLSPSGSPSPPPSVPQALHFSPEKNESPFSGDFTGAAQVEAKPVEDTCPGEVQQCWTPSVRPLTITPHVGSRPPADLPLIDFCSPPEADVALGSASRPLIDLTTNTPDVNRNCVSKNSVSKPLQAEGQLIDLGSPLVQLSPEADKENVDSPLLKF
uniref:G2 and S-phase expressed 1 n=1 Tax=Spermophilus dauricus TaxID=99837 RepID=A0A8C9PSI1_SPEDA